MSWILGEWREVESSPSTGKCSARPAGKPGDFLLALQHLRRSLPRHSIPAAINTGRPVCVFQGMAESIGPMWANQNPILSRGRTASRQARPRPRTKERVGRTTLFSSSTMSSDRLFLDRVGRHQSPSLLHRRSQNNTHSSQAWGKGDISTLPGTRHFYFALTLSVSHQHLCLDLATILREQSCALGMGICREEAKR